MRLELKSILCYQTTAEAGDEPFLKIFADDNPHFYVNFTTMSRGVDWEINRSIDFNSRVRIQLWEHDQIHNDFIGEFEVSTSHERGAFDIILPDSGAELFETSHGDPVYSISYEVGRGMTDVFLLRRWDLELLSIRCGDAQEGTDEIEIKLDNHRIWEGDMRTDETKLLNLHFSVSSPVKIELWEQDSFSNWDCIGTKHITIGHGFRGHIVERPQSFTLRNSTTGDSRYIIEYRVSERDNRLPQQRRTQMFAEVFRRLMHHED